MVEMKREFHIFASRSDTRFVMKGVGEGFPREFDSLFEAALHARNLPGCDGGMMVIYSDDGHMVNRIPFRTAARHRA